ncbi:MAG: hypothetical protein IBX72_08685 [Nitrospirae bacterium]|nr:hypothetical protein [Nitrospirota bacterium]
MFQTVVIFAFVEAGKILGTEVLDHIIISKNNFFSFQEKGLLK